MTISVDNRQVPVLLLTGLAAALLFSFSAGAQGDLKLWYGKPAEIWLEALPIGNSHLGAMVYGGIPVERIQLNEETFWSGSPYRNDSPDAIAHLGEIRNLIFSDQEDSAFTLINKYIVTGPHGMRYLPMGAYSMRFDGHDRVSDYVRDLNLDQGGYAIAGGATGVFGDVILRAIAAEDRLDRDLLHRQARGNGDQVFKLVALLLGVGFARQHHRLRFCR